MRNAFEILSPLISRHLFRVVNVPYRGISTTDITSILVLSEDEPRITIFPLTIFKVKLIFVRRVKICKY